MERVNKILKHDLFKEYLEKNKRAEENRRFCHHDMGHFLDVARLGMILSFKQRCDQTPWTDGGTQTTGQADIAGDQEELIYAAALLHDIGRWKQYEDGTPHELASAKLSPAILADCGFTEEETERIVTAISNHRNESVREEQSLSGILYRADKMSRSCFCCEAEAECDWKGKKKNLELRY